MAYMQTKSINLGSLALGSKWIVNSQEALLPWNICGYKSEYNLMAIYQCSRNGQCSSKTSKIKQGDRIRDNKTQETLNFREFSHRGTWGKPRDESQKPGIQGDLCWLITQRKSVRKMHRLQSKTRRVGEASTFHKQQEEPIVRSSSTTTRKFFLRRVSNKQP